MRVRLRPATVFEQIVEERQSNSPELKMAPPESSP